MKLLAFQLRRLDAARDLALRKGVSMEQLAATRRELPRQASQHACQRRPDASLCRLDCEAAHSSQKYSCQHALLRMLIAEQAATTLAWPAARRDSLGRAALCINLAMQRLQDKLAMSTLPINAATRAEIPLSALPPKRQSARLLRRVDLVAAKIGRRASCAPVPPASVRVQPPHERLLAMC